MYYKDTFQELLVNSDDQVTVRGLLDKWVPEDIKQKIIDDFNSSIEVVVDEKSFYMTAEDLKKALENVPDDTPVYYQRIEDIYFEKHGWKREWMSFDEDGTSEYTRAFSAYLHPDTDRFVLNAHY